ncbi:MAG: TonB-dependent receptor [Chitinophagaceae bacterium]|nr:TonB-dependent receptor [Chitinophagaceae bacterium]
MKKWLSFLLCTSVCFNTLAQKNISITTDSLHIIELNELTVSGIIKTPQQHLVNFFKSNNAATLEDILSRLPEISILRRGAYGMEPSIRYYSDGQINVLLDGMQIHGACTDKMDPATIYIEPINLQNLQVQTGNSGFANGSAIGGTVNMKMIEPQFDCHNKITGAFNSGYQTAAKSVYESVRLNYALGNWAFAVSGTYRNSKNYKSGGGEIIPFSQYKKVNYSISAKFQYNKSTYFKADFLADDGWNIGYPALPMDVGYATAKIASLSMHNENFRKRLYKWQAKIYANSIEHFMDDTKRPFVPMHMDMPGFSKTVGAFADGELKLNAKQKLLFRADGASTFLTASMTMYQAGQPNMYMLTWPDNRKNKYGFSASWLLQPDSTMQIKLSGRTDMVLSNLTTSEAKNQISILTSTFNGRADFLKNISAQISKKIGQKIKLTSSIGYVQRMPTATEMFGFYLFNSSDGFDYLGNPSIKPEKALLVEASVIYNVKKCRIQWSGYYNRVTNFIAGKIEPSLSTMTIGANGVKSFSNIPFTSIAGAEFSVYIKPQNAADIVSTVKYTWAKDNNNNPLPFVAPLKNITSVKYQLKKISVQVETEAALKQSKISKQYGEDATPGYFLIHTRFGYITTIYKKEVELQIGAENVLDKKYHEHLDWGNLARPGRNFYIQLKIAF